MSKKVLIALIVIVLAAFFLRFYRVTEDPPSLNWDEVSIGYNAYSILKTGHDEWGVFIPLHFKSYGEYKLPAQIYASIPAIAIFGLNDFGVRITPVVYGTLTILLLFFLTRKLFKNDVIALISAFLLAISPWHLQLTRASFESSFALMWIVLGLWLMVKGLEERKYLVMSVIPFAISMYTYNSARVFVPLFIFALSLIYLKKFWRLKKTVLLAIIFFVVLLLPLVPFVLSGEGSARYKLVSIADDPGLVNRINEHRGLSKLPQPLPRLIHNKVTYLAYYYTQNYLAHFTPQFLFISGAPHKQHHVQNIGELYLFQAPFLLLGLYWLFKKKQPWRWLLVSWILLNYIPVAVTNDSIPHALRTLNAVPAYQIISAFGIYEAYLLLRHKSLYKNLAISSAIIVVIMSLSYYFYQYYQIYPINYSRDWQYGNKQVVEYIKQHYSEYDQIVFSRTYGEPHMFSLFYLQYDPAKFQNDPTLDRFETHDWVRVLHFDKFYFPDFVDQGTRFADIVAANPGKKLLFIGKDIDFPVDYPKLKEINFLNGQPAFAIVEVK